MMLADHGARVIRVERPAAAGKFGDGGNRDILNRSRERIELDLKDPAAIEQLKQLACNADGLIEGFRPGVIERLGLGPEVLLAENPKIVIGRMTGWGQDGPIAHTPGHDINYIALTGALHTIGTRAGGPVPPLNLIGDYGGGALYMVVGVLAAYIETQRSGKGQIVDTSMVEGAASLMTPTFGYLAAGAWIEERESNRLDGGCHHYNVYETSDGHHICIGSNEPQFYKEMLATVGLGDAKLPAQTDRTQWPAMRAKLAAIFKTKTRAQWTELMEQKEICYAPVLSMSESMAHPQNVARGTFVTVDGVAQPGPAPRFTRTPSTITHGPAHAGQHSREVLADWGVDAGRIETLVASGAVKQR